MSIELHLPSDIYEKIVDIALDACCIVATDSFLIYASNIKAQQLLGYTAQELVGCPLSALFSHKDIHLLERTIHSALSNPEKGSTAKLETATQKHFYAEYKILQLEQFFVLTLRESAESSPATQELSALQNKLQAIDSANRMARIGNWQVDLVEGIAFWSEETAKIHGFNQAMQFSVEDGLNFYAPHHRELITEKFYQCANAGAAFDEVLELITKDGKTLWVRAIGEPEYSQDGQIRSVRGSFQDVDDLVRAKLKVDELETNLADTLEQISDAFFTLDTQWRFTYVNSKAELLLKKTKEMLLGHNVWLLFPEAIGSEFQHNYEHAVQRQETVRFSSFYAPLQSLFEVSAYPTAKGLAVYFKDMTLLDELSKRTKQAERLEGDVGHLEALTRLTGGIAHDFNNLLTVVMSNAEYLYEKMPANSDFKKNSKLILSAAQKSSHLTQHLLAFSSKQILSPQAVQLDKLMMDVRELAASIVPTNISLYFEIKEPDTVLFIDKGKLQLSLLNIFINACEAMPKGGSITVETFRPVSSELSDTMSKTLKDYIQIRISDSGPGMSDYVRHRAFTPYFTTKDTVKNHGLGLSSVYGFVQQSEGTVFIEAETTPGCSINLVFPCQRQHHRQLHSKADPALDTLQKTILLVEDDELLLQYLKLTLTDLGYQVDCSSTADAALPMLEQKNYNIVLSDVVTPGTLDGFQLSQVINQKYPETKVLLSSGYNNYAEEINQQKGKNFQYIEKPYKLSNLLHLLKE